MREVLAGSTDDGVVWSARLGAHLEAARQRAGMRRVDLATRVGVSEETIRLWERGAVQPSPERLVRLIPILAIEASFWQQDAAEGGDDDLPELARRLRAERAARGLTQAALAEQLGVAQATYAGWEGGRATPGPQHEPVVADLLDLDAVDAAALINSPMAVDTTGWPPLGQLMGARRRELQLSRAALADRLGTSSRSVMSWELGYRRPPAAQFPALAEALAVPVEQVVGTLPRCVASGRLGQLILDRQRALGLHSTDLARLVGTTEPTVSRWINGRSRPGRANLTRLASALRIPLAQLNDVMGSPT